MLLHGTICSYVSCSILSPDAAYASSIAGFDSLSTAGAECIAVLSSVVSQILRVLGVWAVRVLKAQKMRVLGR